MFSRTVPAKRKVSWSTTPKLAAEVGFLQGPHVVPIEQDCALVDLVEPGQHVDDRRLAGSGRTDQGDQLPRCGMDIDVLEDRGDAIVREADVFEDDITLKRRHERRVGGVDLGHLIKDFEDTLGSGDRGLQLVVEVGDFVDRSTQLPRVVHEGGDRADRGRMPLTTSQPPTPATRARLRLPTKFIIGPTNPAKVWAFVAAAAQIGVGGVEFARSPADSR